MRSAWMCLIGLTLLGGFAGNAFAGWVYNGNPVCTAVNHQTTARIAPDGAGGAIVVWEDFRSLTDYDIYAQRLDGDGVPVWGIDGVPICTAALNQNVTQIIPDGAGGAIIVWRDYRDSIKFDIYVQRVDAAGNPLWTPNGLVICGISNHKYNPRLVSDGAGGAIVVWQDTRTGFYDVYAQRVNAAGTPLWAANGIGVCIASGHQYNPEVTSDGAGGAIVTWYDARGADADIYVQRVNGSGTAQWAANGVALCAATDQQYYPTLDADGNGGAIVTWYDYRNGLDADIYAGRVDASGAFPWTADGVALCTASSQQYYPRVVSDGAGGGIVTWYDYRNGPADIYARRVSAGGAALWTATGLALCSATEDQYDPRIVSDGEGGAIITWEDYRSGTSDDVYAQRVTGDGAVLWNTNGMQLSTATNNQSNPEIASDGAGGAIVAWIDNRSSTGLIYDVYAQRVEPRYGYWGRPEPVVVSAEDNPGDQGGKVALNWQASGRDVLNQQLIYRYSIWRAIDPALAAQALVVDTPRSDKAAPGKALIWRERAATVDYYWELVATQDAYYYPSYSYLTPTRQDSTGGTPAVHYFRVVAESYSQFLNWPSNVLSGYSVDNLAPAAPLMLYAQRSGNDVLLHWTPSGENEPDFKEYVVYRAGASGVTPTPIFFLSSAPDSMLTDTGAPATALYYIVTAFDVHENQSPPSNEAMVSGTGTDVGDRTPALTHLELLANAPNPFGAATEIRFGLPVESRVRVEIYDVAGRRVRAHDMGAVGAGWQRFAFDGRDDTGRALPSGVYFYRVSAAGETQTRKMVIQR